MAVGVGDVAVGVDVEAGVVDVVGVAVGVGVDAKADAGVQVGADVGVDVAATAEPGDCEALNSEALAGTSLRNARKIWLSSGCVHRTLAVSPGTTSPRGKFGSVKKAMSFVGMARRLCPRSYRPVMPPSWLSIVSDLVAESRNR